MDVKDIAIENIGLSVRAYNALYRQGVRTVGQLMEYTEEKLSSIRNLGAKTVEEILRKIEEYRVYAENNEVPPRPAEDDSASQPDLSALLDSKDIDEVTIDEIQLSVRAVNALHAQDINTLGQLLELTEERLRSIRNLGAKTIDEILNVMKECRSHGAAAKLPETPENLYQSPDGRDFVIRQLREKNTGIDALDFLPARAFNLLSLHGYTMLHQILFMDPAELQLIKRMDPASASEIRLLCDAYLRKNGEAFLKAYILEKTRVSVFDMVYMPEHQDEIRRFAEKNDRPVQSLGLSSRPATQLQKNGYTMLSQILFLRRDDLMAIHSLGANSIEEILRVQREYLSANENRILAWCAGDESALLDDESIRSMILDLYAKIGFGGLSLNEMLERLGLPDSITVERIKRIIGGLLAENALEYVDYRCYRVYPRFSDALRACAEIDDRTRRILQKRLNGDTLEVIGAAEDKLSRERVRQIVQKGFRNICDWNERQTSLRYFDEDYYRYLFSNYRFERDDAVAWFGIPAAVFSYLDMQDIKNGSRPLADALSDHEIDAGLRLKIKNYLNRNRLWIDGVWVEKKRADLEEVVARKYCQDEVSFDEFKDLYNEFLRQHEIPDDGKLYYTEDISATRKNRLTDSRFLLWKQGGMLRYYDIDSRDYSELFTELNLDDYENIEISALKLIDMYPEIMKKYDIRDQYELHNLLKKITNGNVYPGIQFGRMPMMTFGSADRSSQLLNLLIDHAPLSLEELYQFAREEYGYESGAILWKDVVDYYHDGLFTVDQKVMPTARKEALQAALKDDFYYFHEIQEIYSQLFPDADPEEINSYNLRQMGFIIRSKYAVQHHSTLEAYFTHLLTSQEILDISVTRKRFSNIQAFSQTLSRLKREFQIVEYEQNRFIHIRRLEKSGVTRASIQAFCDAVWAYVPDGTYFNAASLRQDGFVSDLYDLGFSDWFYDCLLSADSRFSCCSVFGTIILCKGKTDVTIKDFESSLIRAAGEIDAYDLLTEMTAHYGCKITDRNDLVYKVRDTGIYYDRILDRFYENEAAFERDLDRAEGM